MTVAKKASDDGHWVRLHTLTWGDGDTETSGGATSEFVVDVFDALIPAEAREE